MSGEERPTREALLGFVRWIAEHPDVGDSLTAAEREMRFQQEARLLAAGDESVEAWGNSIRREQDGVQEAEG